MNKVEFGPIKQMGVLGMLLGASVAIFVPLIVLKYGQAVGMGSFAATLLVLAGIFGGVLLAVAAAFFSIVMPTRITTDKDPSAPD